MNRLVTLSSLSLLLGVPMATAPARAELWSALDTVPRPNAVIGYDTSVTMRIDENCNSCHRDGLPEEDERVWIAREQLLDALPLFEDYFVFGGFQYEGCGAAGIARRALPNVADPDASYQATYDLLRDARGCNRSETRFPGGSRISCITPTPMCSGDPPVAEAILRGGLTGLNLPPLPTNTSTVCGNPARVSATFDLEGFLLSQAAGMTWPRWDDDHITGRHVQDDLCSPLYTVLAAARTALNRCLVDPAAYWDLSGITGVTGTWCTPGLIANHACTTSPLVGTCVCDGDDDDCHDTAGLPRSACGLPLTWKARQQVAVCETYNPTTFGSAFVAQADNRVNVGGCRENVAMFFTDGYQGHRPGVYYEAQVAQNTYGSADGEPNMFVFHVSSSFGGAANQMMRYVSNDQIPVAFSATDGRRMRSSFSQVLARVYRGDYAGSSPALSYSGDRVALSSFVVPGHTAGSVSDTYIGWPMRVALHAIDDAGNIDPDPLFQTDWSTKVGRASSCGYHEIGGVDTIHLGPGGRFDNQVSRDVTVPMGSLGDRDGDGTPEPDRALTWGRFFGFGAGKPVIVNFGERD